VATETGKIIKYPIVEYDDLTIDPLFRELQQQGPIRIQLPYGEPCWLATRYEDVKFTYGDRRFGKALGVGRDTPRMYPNKIDDPTLMANQDPPDHTRLRRLTSGAFAPAQIRTMRGWIEGLVDELLDDLVAQERPDFVPVVALMLPIRVIAGILGVSDSDVPSFRRWVDEMLSRQSDMETRLQALESMRAGIRGLIEERRARSTDDLLSIMVHARDEDDRLTEEELISLGQSLVLAGFETTAAQLGSTIYTLMAHRHLWQELLDDRAVVPAALEELWRWIPSFRHGSPMIRWASEDAELSGGVVIPAGQAVLAEHQVANRDESVFPHASELDFHRVDPQPHLALGWGAHRCMGAQLAYMEIEVTLEKLLDRFPALELAVAPEDVKWSPTTFLRSPAELPLTLNA
jgi:cytochrome P450 RapN